MYREMKMISESHRRIIRELVHGQFLDPEDTNLQYLIQLVETCLKSVVEHQGSGPTYPYTLDAVPISTAIESAEIPYKPVDLSENSQPNHSKPLQLFLEILPSA